MESDDADFPKKTNNKDTTGSNQTNSKDNEVDEYCEDYFTNPNDSIDVETSETRLIKEMDTDLGRSIQPDFELQTITG